MEKYSIPYEAGCRNDDFCKTRGDGDRHRETRKYSNDGHRDGGGRDRRNHHEINLGENQQHWHH